MRLILLSIGLLAAGCGSDSLSDYMDEDLPAGMCEDTEGDACETGGPGEACEASSECGGDLLCAATFNGDIGTFECQSACVSTMDEARWCVDDTSCCDADARCGQRGYCTLDDDVDSGIDTSGDEASESGSSDSSTDGGADSGTRTDAETGTDTGTSTDAGTESSTGGSSG